ncbi:MAG: hypothetical protein KDA85_11520, partial [Planctomycetaceae bacterium]|nr:hypothetical protein [Planctomycetaceae bacterium]
VFTDLRTTWVIAGIGHGHQSVTQPGIDPNLLLESSPDGVTASAGVLPYTEINADNIDSFHFHGDAASFPITTIIAVPASDRDRILLLGRYAAARTSAQCLKPPEVIGELMMVVLRVEQLVWISSALAVTVTVLMLGLVLFLSLRLRAVELHTMYCLGCSRGIIVQMAAGELLLMVTSATALALVAARASLYLSSEYLRSFLF